MTVLLLSFPGHWNITASTKRWIWRRWSGRTLRLPSRCSFCFPARWLCGRAAILFFSGLYLQGVRPRAEPIMLAIAAVTLSTMHQSSSAPVFSCRTSWRRNGGRRSCRFVPALRGRGGHSGDDPRGILIAKAWSRRLSDRTTIAMGRITFGRSVYLAFRVGDLAFAISSQAHSLEKRARFLRRVHSRRLVALALLALAVPTIPPRHTVRGAPFALWV